MTEIRTHHSGSGAADWLAPGFDRDGAAKRRALAAARRAVRILLVDDSDDDRVRFCRALSGAGYEVHAAEDGAQAWARLQEQSFDVLVSDRQMPGTDGLELTRRVRSTRAFARLPVIMVSAMDAPSDRAAGLAAGAAEYICKTNAAATPVLLDSVERLTGAASGEAPAPALFERALVVDRSSVARHLLERTLRVYCSEIASVESVDAAREQLGAGGVSLVLLGATMPGALAWFEERRAWASGPPFVIVTSRPSEQEETRVSMLGAIGYLAKPIAVRELSHVLVSSAGDFAPAPPRAHAFPLAQASIADPASGEPQLSCPVLDLSAEGALLGTPVPIPAGTRLFLCLAVDGRRISLRARVVRIQEPGWNLPAGCGVVFEYDRDDDRRAVERFVDARTESRSQPRGAASPRRA
jgi:DNA-binding response OmpR family regulator